MDPITRQTTRKRRAAPSTSPGAAWNLSKITPPTLQRVHPNQRLFGRLDAARLHRVVWVHGPPGAGKTTLTASYLAARGVTPLWYRLDEGDTDPATLFFYLANAARQISFKERISPKEMRSLPLLSSEFRGALPLFARRFFRDLFAISGISVVVFDDYHEIEASAALHECLPHGLEEVPEGCHVVIISRTPPPAQLARLRLNGIIDVVEPDALRMTLEEAGGLARERGAEASAARVEQITRQTQGWTAGLILMLEAGGADPVPAIEDATAVPEILFDYFAGEILQRMDARTQRLLCRLALMPSMTAEAAERLTGAAEASALLEDLRKRNYFTSRDTSREPRYRFHPLFRDFLLESARAQVPRDELSALRIRAATILDGDGQPDPAVGLLAEAAAFDILAALVKRRAAVLLDEGRGHTLEAWLSRLPPSMIEGDAWLSYWSGMARLDDKPVDARPRLQNAFALFKRAEDATGQFLAWAGQAISLRVDAFADNRRFDPLLADFRELIARHPDIGSANVVFQVAIGMTTALYRRSNDRSAMVAWQQRGLAAAAQMPGRERSELLLVMFVISDFHDGNYRAVRSALDRLPDPLTLDHRPLQRINGLMAHTTALLYRQRSGDCGAYVEEAIPRIEASGFHLWLPLFACLAANAACRGGDLAASDKWLRRTRAYADQVLLDPGAPYENAVAQHHILSGDLVAARKHAEAAVSRGVENGWRFFEVIGRLTYAEVLVELADFEAATAELARIDALLASSMTRMAVFGTILLKADLRFAQGDGCGGTTTLKEAMAFGRAQGDNSVQLTARRVARLCSQALRSNIEPDFVRAFIRVAEIPAPDPYDEAWSWPLRISTLGGLTVTTGGAALTFSRKTPKRLLALLKAIVAYGGREVPEEKLIDAVWPDEEGDSGQSALRIAIHRLRKLLGDGEAIIVSGGRVGLDPARCWLDLWTVDHLFTQDTKTEAGDISRCERLFAVYSGDFLAGDEGLYWTGARRDQLRGRFVAMVCASAEARGGCDAVALYHRGLDAAPDSEELYQGLMRCHLARGQGADGLAVYRRLRAVLDGHAAAAPAPASETLHRKLQAL